MKGMITVAFDYTPEATQVTVSADMRDQAKKNFSIIILMEAIKVILNYEHSPIIKPAALHPGMVNGNGQGIKAA